VCPITTARSVSALRYAIYVRHQALSPALQLRMYDKLLAQADDARRFTGQGRAA
jgi:hypothetical protein